MKQMNSKDRIEVSEEMQEKALHFNKYDPSEIGYEGALRDLWERRITYQEFNQQVKKLKEMNTDWYDLLFHTSFTQSYNLSVSGGSDRVNYYISAGYNDQKGVAKPEKYTRYNALAKVDVNLYPNLKIGADVSSARVKSKRTHSSVDLYQYAYETSRAIPAYNEDGSDYFYTTKEGLKNTAKDYYSPDIKFNIFHELDHSGYESTTSNTSMNFHLDWKLFSMFNWHTQFNLTTTHTNEQEWVDEQSTFAQSKRLLAYGVKEPDAKLASNYYTDTELPMGGILNEKDYRGQSYQLTSSLSYFQTFQKHEINAIAGIEINSRKMDGKTETNYGYLRERGHKFAKIVLENYSKYRNTVAENYPAITDTKDNKVSFYGAFTYTFDNRYSFNFNIRADGSNQFGKDISTRFLPIWSISGRWNAHEELFLQNVKWLEVLAVRGSFGIQGNVNEEQVPDMILTMGGMDNISEEYSSTLYKVPNDHLKWEKTRSYNLGAMASVFKNSLMINFEYYYKKTSDAFMSKTISDVNGFNTYVVNSGTLRNRGWNVGITATPVKTKDFNWILSGSLSKVTNTMSTLPGQETYELSDFLNGTAVVEGMPIGTFYSYKYMGLSPVDGGPMFDDWEDRKSELVDLDKYSVYTKVLVPSGQRDPDMTGSINNTFNYKQWRLGISLNYSIGGSTRLFRMMEDFVNGYSAEANINRDMLKAWKKPGDELTTDIPAIMGSASNGYNYYSYHWSSASTSDVVKIADNAWTMYDYSDLRVVSADYLKISSISLTYEFPRRILSRWKLERLALTLGATNLYTFCNSKLRGQTPTQGGFSDIQLSDTPTYTIGLNLNF